MANILIGGDTCPIGYNQKIFQMGDAKLLLGDLLAEFDNADLSIINLECPLIQRESPIKKSGPNLGVPVDCVKGLKAMGIDMVGLSNNHIMDHGISGFQTTIEALKDHGITHVGAGKSLVEAQKIQIFSVKGVRIGILAVAEYEFGIAEENTPGANPINVINFVRNIREHKAEFDKLVVLVHAGNEHYLYPRPRLMDMCHFYVEQGANAVICQHSHCAGCMEIYQGAPIIYGQGNFLFNYPSDKPTWHEGVLISLESHGVGNFGIRLIPYRQSDGKAGVRKMTTDEKEFFNCNFTERSNAITNNSFVKEQWEKFCKSNNRYYLNTLYGKPGFLRRLAGKLNLLHYLDSQNVQRERLNLIRCESHREALITALRLELDK